MNTLPWLLIPVRSLAQGKSRLAEVLSERQRRQLNADLLDHLLQQAKDWPGLARSVVVSSCEQALALARAAGAATLLQPARPGLDESRCETLNADLEQARRSLPADTPRPLLVVACDLPLASADDWRRLAALGGQRQVLVATDRSGHGSNALYLPAGADVPFCFGPDSAARHLQAAQRLGWAAACVTRPGLAFDIDTPTDYQAWLQIGHEAGCQPTRLTA